MLRNPIPKRMGKHRQGREVQVSANYKDFEWKTQISADEGTVDNYLFRGDVKPVAPSKGDLWRALEWLALYDAGDDLEVAQSLANVVAFLSSAADTKEKREVIAEAKRQYAKAHGIKVSQVRLKK
jgi:Zn-dependent M32 family carboxypeptidase